MTHSVISAVIQNHPFVSLSELLMLPCCSTRFRCSVAVYNTAPYLPCCLSHAYRGDVIAWLSSLHTLRWCIISGTGDEGVTLRNFRDKQYSKYLSSSGLRWENLLTGLLHTVDWQFYDSDTQSTIQVQGNKGRTADTLKSNLNTWKYNVMWGMFLHNKVMVPQDDTVWL